MNGRLARGVIGFAIACGAVVVGPVIGGTAVAKADLLGAGPDINVVGIDLLGGTKSHGASARRATAAGVPAVSTVPRARSVVVRAEAPVTRVEPTVYPASLDSVAEAPAVGLGARAEAVPPAPQIPAAPPLSVPLPAGPVIAVPAPDAVTVPPTVEPGAAEHAPAERPSPAAEIPASFRVGYAENLRSATMSDLFVAALPGVAGLAGFTLVGAYAGYRQARSVQAALLAPVPTTVLL
jgi:hypothetical protein